MFPVKKQYIQRIVFTSKLFPPVKSPIKVSDVNTQSEVGAADAFCAGRSSNRDLLTFFGGISDALGFSCYAQLPTFRRSLKKLTRIVETELAILGSQEVLLPTLVPLLLWHKSGRLDRHPGSLRTVFRTVDHENRDLLLGPTFEESITHLMKHIDGQISASQLPLILHQTSAKFRLEMNPKFGIIRSNEFFMNDMYSFDKSLEAAIDNYNVISGAYERIFKRLGLNCIKAKGNPGSIGGKFSHEYQLPSLSGEDSILKCNICDYASNDEVVNESDLKTCPKCKSRDVQDIKTVELGHTFLLSDLYSKPMGAEFSFSEGSKKHLEMGCYGLGLTRIIGAGVDILSCTPERGKSLSTDPNLPRSVQIRWPKGVEPFTLGIVCPAKRSKQNQAGSTAFIKNLVDRILSSTHHLDILVEDRDKDGIRNRIEKLQGLGLPHIIVIGSRFLQESPEIEVLRLDERGIGYDQFWFSEAQLLDYIRQEIETDF